MTIQARGRVCEPARVPPCSGSKRRALLPRSIPPGSPPCAAVRETMTDMWTLDSLQQEADALRQRLNRFRTSLGRFFVGKQELIDLMLVTAIAGEPLLLVGPPGTAKSDLVLKFKDALGLSEEDYFEYMLTRFTEPSEIIGPIDISKLREGNYVRRVLGKLPTA